ncbi:MAG: hypothetical protein WA919_24610 [Coleofasciculaceae cyanobacterium]
MNLLILTVYLICVTYVFNNAFQVLDSLVTVNADSESIDNQLEEQKIKDLIAIKFPFKNGYKLDNLNDLKSITIIVNNKTLERKVEINWNESSLSDFGNSAGRVIRLTPGMDKVPQSQASSIMLPGQTIQEQLSNENISSPLFKANKLREAALDEKQFHLQLIFNISDPATGEKKTYRLRCPFVAKKLHWKKAFGLLWK